MLRAGGLGVRDLRRTALALDVEESVAGFVAESAYIAGLLAPDGEPHERYAPTPEYDRWLAQSTGELIQRARGRLVDDDPSGRLDRHPRRP